MTKRLRLLLVLVGALALASPVLAQSTNDTKPTASPLVRLLQSKGILTDAEVAMVSQASSQSEADARLAKLLLSKGLISQEEYNQTVGASMQEVAADSSNGARMVPAVLRVPVGGSPKAAEPPAAAPSAPAAEQPKVIPAVAPIRVLAVDPPKREGLVPDLKIGPVKVKPYGFYKATVVHDTSSPYGNDFPLPGFISDSGPDSSPEFHIKDRALRLGSNFEWIDPSPKVAVTGRLEVDFEGNFTRANNVNISSIRNPEPRIRLAWGRVDYSATDNTTLFALFGQDWTPFASSTLPNLLETTGLGIGFGTLYTRQPQFRGGFIHNFGGSRSVKILPEIAVVLPAFGNLPGSLQTASATGAVSGMTGVEQQLGEGERQGVDSARPEIQGRLALQFQLDKAPGVAPAQIIGSFFEGKRQATILAAAVPAAFRAAFPHGADVTYQAFGFTGEIQVPTRYATVVAKYYSGQDLRWFFEGQIFSNYNDLQGLVAGTSATALSVDGSATVTFGTGPNGPTVFPQRPVRSQGGFVQLGLPLSRIFNANPDGRNAGWQLYFTAGLDEARAKDVRRLSATAGNRYRGDLLAGTLYYKLNNWVSFGVEESLYRTLALPNPAGVLTTLFRGIPSRSWHDFRSEIGPIFTF